MHVRCRKKVPEVALKKPACATFALQLSCLGLHPVLVEVIIATT